LFDTNGEKEEDTMNEKKMLITGAAGMVGSYAAQVFTDYELFLTDRMDGFVKLDVRDPLTVRKTIADIHPDIVLHLAAETDVDRCEIEPNSAYHTNAIGTQNVALACQANGTVLVYVSTAGVFSGDKPEPYNEFDAPNPVNTYGQSKLAGEQIVSSLLQRYYIVRAGWMMGGGERDKKFVGKIAQLLLGGERPLRAVVDKLGSPTYGKDLLKGIRMLLETEYYGLYHMVNEGRCTRYDVALEIRDSLKKTDVEIMPVSSAYFPLPAPRARSEAMHNLKLQLLGLPAMRPWEDALQEYLMMELAPSLIAL
jgi:dTDP-4-dehydrorhamnose reductase